MKLSFLSIILSAAAVFSLAACKSASPGNGQNAQQSDNKAGGSLVETSTAADGTKVEVRRFEDGELSKLTRITRPGGERFVLVEFRDSRTARLKDHDLVESALDATPEAIIVAANTIWAQNGSAPAQPATFAVGKSKEQKAGGTAEKQSK